MTEEELEKIETELSSLCIQGLQLPKDSPKHDEIRKGIDEWHKKYDHLFE